MIICVTNRKLCQDDFLSRLDRIAAQHPYAVILREKDLSEGEYEKLAAKCLAICKSHGVPMQVHTWVDVARRIGCDGIHLPFQTFMEYINNGQGYLAPGSFRGEAPGSFCGEAPGSFHGEAPRVFLGVSPRNFSEAVQEEKNAACGGEDKAFGETGPGSASGFFSGFTRIGVSLHSAEEASALRGTPATYIQAGHIFATDCKRGVPPRGLIFLKEVCQATELPVFAIGGITPERYPAVMEVDAAGACIMSGLMKCQDVEAYMGCFSQSPLGAS